MKCPICGKQTLPGAKLCSPCRAALKRAKDDSVWELPASQRPGEATQPTRDAPWVLGAPLPAVEPDAVPRPPPAVAVELPARPLDPWQRMSDALARCRAQDLFGRLGCEYRVRTSYCEGHWGEVPQCPAVATNDHGQ